MSDGYVCVYESVTVTSRIGQGANSGSKLKVVVPVEMAPVELSPTDVVGEQAPSTGVGAGVGAGVGGIGVGAGVGTRTIKEYS
jgi:hypothetical protein